MEKAEMVGLRAMGNGRGPFRARTKVTTVGTPGSVRTLDMEAEVQCGFGTDPETLAGGSCVVAVLGHCANWLMTCRDPMQAETVAMMLESMQHVSQSQLMGMGFVETQWEHVNAAKARRKQETEDDVC